LRARGLRIERIAFIGLGTMGVPMSAHLAKAGHAVQTHDKRGGGTHASPRHAAEGADLLITMLPDGDVVRDVVLDALPALKAGCIVVDMSSCDPLGTQALGTALAANGIAMVDAPVSGAVRGARDASLAIMCGGAAADFARVRPLLEKLGRDIFHVGPLGAGHAVKALNNYLGAAGTLAGFEALILARAFGLEPQPVLDAINASTGKNWTTERKIPQQVLTNAFASGFKLALMAKDMAIAARLAKELNVDAPYLRETLKHWRAAAKAMPRDADHTEIYKYQAKRAKRRKR
jgi:3-hydroxyisobutyrate dehydrogenase